MISKPTGVVKETNVWTKDFKKKRKVPLVTYTYEERTELSGYEFEGRLSELLNYIQNLIEIHGDSAYLSGESRSSYYGETENYFLICTTRDATSEEIAQYEAWEQEDTALRLESTQAQIARLEDQLKHLKGVQ